VQQSLTAATASTLDAYFDELARWSSRLNLTSIPRERMWSRNVGDAGGLLDVAAPAPGVRVVDVGSGGGAPGMIVAILRPDLQVTLLESDVRKSGFLVHVAGLLVLTNVVVESIRAEDAGRRQDVRESFDLVTSRAAAPPAVLCELALPLLRVGGSLYALVTGASEALESCAAAARACGGGPPEAAAPGLLRVGKLTPTSLEYPRRAGVPSRHPIS
jgi:16S rRNA (guanine527-N7)-methyltransferase